MAFWLHQLQLPSWLSGKKAGCQVSVRIEQGMVSDIVESEIVEFSEKDTVWNGKGRLALSGLSELHTHLDKTYTRERLGHVGPGLLNAIEAMRGDQINWTEKDLSTRIEMALAQAYHQGVTHIRTHIDWTEYEVPQAWSILTDKMSEWCERIHVERVALIPLALFSDYSRAEVIARQVSESKAGILGGFVHSSNFDAAALDNLFSLASKFNLAVDLHIDEEIEAANGLRWLAKYLRTNASNLSITCGHACGLHTLGKEEVSTILAIFAQHKVRIVALPTTNLLLQDAKTGVTPTHRGITQVKEAKHHGVTVMFSSDNVADAFCPYGDYDPVAILRLSGMLAQLETPFESWSSSITYLQPQIGTSPLIDTPADFVIFDHGNVHLWPEYRTKTIMRAGQWLSAHNIGNF